MSGQNTEPGTNPTLPSDQQGEGKLYAGKYKTVEDLEKGYMEAQKFISSRGQNNQQTPPPPATPAPPPATPTPPKGMVPGIDAETAVANAGLNFEELNAEFQEHGKLTDASYEKLQKSGIPKEMVDAYIDGQTARAEANQNAVFDSVGGQKNYAAMIEWAQANLSDGEKQAFNASLNGSLDSVKWAVAGLKQRYDSANGVTPNLTKGDGTLAVGGGYQNREQMVADMKDPRYKGDPAFRKAVQDKVARTTAF